MSTTRVSINDVSLRDGIQSESVFVTHEDRLSIIDHLCAAGLQNIQVASFVHPDRVPQMRGIEALIERLPNKETVLYSALVLNEKGLERLRATALRCVDLSISCSDTHSRKNSGLSSEEAERQMLKMIERAKSANLQVRAGLQCAFDCPFEGSIPVQRVLDLCAALLAAGCDSLSLADSTGKALPHEVLRLSREVLNLSERPVILHLHDTYGLGMANVVAAYDAGIRSFDASLGGVGGCPFIPGATGNVAIEDLVSLFDRQGLASGLALEPLRAASERLERILGYRLPGTMYRILQKKRAAHIAASEVSCGL